MESILDNEFLKGDNKIDNKSSVFGNLENKVSIISNDKTVHWPKMSKAEIGEKLSDLIENH